MAFAKCVGHDSMFERLLPTLRQVEIESDAVAYITYLRWMYNIDRRNVIRIRLDGEFGIPSTWKLAVQSVKSIHKTKYLLKSYFDWLIENQMIHTLPREYGELIFDAGIGTILNGLYLTSTEENRHGLSLNIFYKTNGFRIFSLQELRDMAANDRLWIPDARKIRADDHLEIINVDTIQYLPHNLERVSVLHNIKEDSARNIVNIMLPFSVK